MSRVYSNENFPLDVVWKLREAGHDILTTAEAGKANRGINDAQVLHYAKAHERILVTLNKADFEHLHRVTRDHEGIIVCDLFDFDSMARRIHEALAARSAARNILITVSSTGFTRSQRP
ncbi:MAG: DUF5615 family PIN-like protein [Candidatus Hydrogenedentes bacterium]|nr:DUF5615 family PIN-like protein [Candidatus Hydrogenedentota bacterium]